MGCLPCHAKCMATLSSPLDSNGHKSPQNQIQKALKGHIGVQKLPLLQGLGEAIGIKYLYPTN